MADNNAINQPLCGQGSVSIGSKRLILLIITKYCI